MENNSTKKVIICVLALLSVVLFVILGIRGCSSEPEVQPEDDDDYSYSEPVQESEPAPQADVSSGDWVIDDNSTDEMETIPVGVDEVPAAEGE